MKYLAITLLAASISGCQMFKVIPTIEDAGIACDTDKLKDYKFRNRDYKIEFSCNHVVIMELRQAKPQLYNQH